MKIVVLIRGYNNIVQTALIYRKAISHIIWSDLEISTFETLDLSNMPLLETFHEKRTKCLAHDLYIKIHTY